MRTDTETKIMQKQPESFEKSLIIWKRPEKTWRASRENSRKTQVAVAVVVGSGIIDEVVMKVIHGLVAFSCMEISGLSGNLINTFT